MPKPKRLFANMVSPLMLKGKVAAITGGTRGIGWASAQAIAAQGATIIISGHSNGVLLEERVLELRDRFGIAAEGMLFDVEDSNQVRDFYSAIHKTHKRLDILVNNAGILDDGLLAMASVESFRKTFDVNVLGVVLNMQYASRLMSRNRAGSIINISSIIGRFGNAGNVIYGGSKAAVIGMTLSASKELASAKIRVNAIAPGFIETDMVRHLSPEKYQELMASIKMGRIGTPEDVASAVLFFASDMSSYITGQVLGVDGGMII